MVKYRAHIVFIALMLVYFIVRYLRATVEQLPEFVQFHLTDLLFVPAMSLFALIILRFTRRDQTLIIQWWTVAIQVVIVCLYFEWYLPNNSPKDHLHVADRMDCLMYAIGGFLFILTQPYLTFKAKKTEPVRIPKCKR